MGAGGGGTRAMAQPGPRMRALIAADSGAKNRHGGVFLHAWPSFIFESGADATSPPPNDLVSVLLMSPQRET